jgi:hypothetical protein
MSILCIVAISIAIIIDLIIYFTVKTSIINPKYIEGYIEFRNEQLTLNHQIKQQLPELLKKFIICDKDYNLKSYITAHGKRAIIIRVIGSDMEGCPVYEYVVYGSNDKSKGVFICDMIGRNYDGINKQDLVGYW